MGRLDVDRMLAEMSSTELARWEAYYCVEPWGEWPAERRTAIQDTLIAGAAGRKCSPGDFLPEAWKVPSRPQNWRDMKSKLISYLGHKG
jgi:hypothetical protein